MTPQEAARLTAAQLAFVGDAVWELAVRERIARDAPAPAGAMHRRTVDFVCAGAQARLLARMQNELTEDEADLVRRGRNAHAVRPPRGASPEEYGMATALEALVGYLYLSGQRERVSQLVERAFMG